MVPVISDQALSHMKYMPQDVSKGPEPIFHNHETEEIEEKLAYFYLPKSDLLYHLQIPDRYTALGSHERICSIQIENALSSIVPEFDLGFAFGCSAFLFYDVPQFESSIGLHKLTKIISNFRVEMARDLNMKTYMKHT